MNSKTLKITFAAMLALTAVGGGAWWLGMSQGMAMMAAPEAVAAATADPSQWTIPQGEEATRRHIRDGLKAGDVDPVTEDMLIGQTAELEKFQWFIRAHLESSGGELRNAGASTEAEAADATR